MGCVYVAHQQTLGNAVWVSAAGVHAVNLMRIHVYL